MGFLEWIGIGTVFNKLYSGELKNEINAEIAKEAAEVAGVHLDPDAPLSDASLAGALSERTGIAIRSLRDQQMIKEDLDAYLSEQVEIKTGYHISSFLNIDTLKQDITRIALARLSQELNIPVGVLPTDGVFDPVAIKDALLTWAKAELMNGLAGAISLQVGEIISAGDLEAVVNDINSTLSASGSHENLTARQFAVKIATAMATKSIVEFQQRVTTESKASRRKRQLREAQAKFRQAHGTRMHYVPVGWEYVGPIKPAGQ